MLFNGRALIFTFSGTQVRIAEHERKSLFSQLTTASHHYKTSFDMAIVEIHAVVS